MKIYKGTDLSKRLFVGFLFTAMGMTLSFLLHGYSYDLLIGMFGMFALGIVPALFNITDAEPLVGIAVSIICSVLVYALSYLLTLCIFKRKEY